MIALCTRLTSTLSPGLHERASRLLNLGGLGDRCPSMDYMLVLLDGADFCLLAEQLFLYQLPNEVRRSLANEDFADPRAVAFCADSLCLARDPGPSINRVTKAPPAGHCPVTSTPTTDERDLCYYHKRFGHRVRKRQSPCAFSGNTPASHQ